MPETRLDYIVRTNCGIITRRDIVPRIVCKDGTMFSVQASEKHYAKCQSGRWTSVEVACLENAPKDWPANNEYFHLGASHHDCTGWMIGDDMTFLVYMHLSPEEVKAFIDSHGGEVEHQPDDIGKPLYVNDRPSGRISPPVLTDGAKITHDGSHFVSENRPID